MKANTTKRVILIAALLFGGAALVGPSTATAGGCDHPLFDSPVTYPVGNSPSEVAAGDLNGDGSVDLAVSDSFPFNADVYVLLNNGDGTFAPAVPYAVDDNAQSVIIDDFNSDDNPDIAVGNSSSENVSAY